MRLMLVGTIVDSTSNILSARIVDIDQLLGRVPVKGSTVLDIPISKILAILSKTPTIIENIAVDKTGTSIVGTNGNLDRYAKIRIDRPNLIDNNQRSPLVILEKLITKSGGLVGYNVSDCFGNHKTFTLSDTLQYSKENTIANGKVVIKDDTEYISSIIGEYPSTTIERSTTGNAAEIQTNKVYGKNGETGVARDAKNDLTNEICAVDEFEVLSEAQRKVITDYYIWYTVEIYKKLNHTASLGISIAKLKRFEALRGDEVWHFGGVVDGFWQGRFKCEFGHPLRYAFYALPEGATQLDQGFIFGSQCASEFFNLTPESMKALAKARDMMSQEIEETKFLVESGSVETSYNDTAFLKSILDEIQAQDSTGGTPGAYSKATRDKVVQLFGQRAGNFLMNFLNVSLPLPKSLVLLCSFHTSKLDENGLGKFYKLIFPEYSKAIDRLTNSATTRELLVDAQYATGGWGRVPYYLSPRLLKHYATDVLEGVHAYNPLVEKGNRRDIGKYNESARIEFGSHLRALNGDHLTTTIRVPYSNGDNRDTGGYNAELGKHYEFNFSEIKIYLIMNTLLCTVNSEILTQAKEKINLDLTKKQDLVEFLTNSKYLRNKIKGIDGTVEVPGTAEPTRVKPVGVGCILLMLSGYSTRDMGELRRLLADSGYTKYSEGATQLNTVNLTIDIANLLGAPGITIEGLISSILELYNSESLEQRENQAKIKQEEEERAQSEREKRAKEEQRRIEFAEFQKASNDLSAQADDLLTQTEIQNKNIYLRVNTLLKPGTDAPKIASALYPELLGRYRQIATVKPWDRLSKREQQTIAKIYILLKAEGQTRLKL